MLKIAYTKKSVTTTLAKKVLENTSYSTRWRTLEYLVEQGILEKKNLKTKSGPSRRHYYLLTAKGKKYCEENVVKPKIEGLEKIILNSNLSDELKVKLIKKVIDNNYSAKQIKAIEDVVKLF